MSQEDTFTQAMDDRKKQLIYDALPTVSYAHLVEVVTKWLLVPDTGVIKTLIAQSIANIIPSDPVWLFLIAPSGGGKTMFMDALAKCPDYYQLSQLTPNTLLSGMKNKEKEVSLLKRLPPNSTLGFKDFTSLLDGNQDDLKAIFGQFREMYDGSMVKVTGTGDEIRWEGKIGFLAGCTPIIEQRLATVGSMGERFLYYKITNPGRKELLEKMRSNIGKEGNMREEIQDAFAGCRKGIVVPEVLPELPSEVDALLEAVTDFVAIGRAIVMRGRDSKREIEYIVEPEMSGRTYKQFRVFALALFIMNGNQWLEEDTRIIKTLAMSSIHSIRLAILHCIASYSTQVKTSTVAMQLGYPTSTARRYLEDLSAITLDGGRVKILVREHQGKGKPDLWKLHDGMKAILASMGEMGEATKEDANFLQDEEDIPAGTDSLDVGPSEDEMDEYKTMFPSVPGKL